MTSNWGRAGESWDAAGRTSRNYRPRVRKMHGPVGLPVPELKQLGHEPALPGGGEMIHDDRCCRACGVHVCSCGRKAKVSSAQPGEPASRAFKVGDRVVVAGRKGFLDALSQLRGDAAWWVTTDCGPRYLLPERDIKHEPEAPTPGTFEWLKTLPPETPVRRPSWNPGAAYRVCLVLGESNTVWHAATDWELA